MPLLDLTLSVDYAIILFMYPSTCSCVRTIAQKVVDGLGRNFQAKFIFG